MVGKRLFKDLDDRELALLLSHCGSMTHFEEGQAVLVQGEVDDSNLFIIVVGRVEVRTVDEHGKTVILSSLENGDMFGEFALFTREARSADVITTEYTEVLKIDMERLDEIFEVDARTAFKLVKYIAKESAKKMNQRNRRK